MYGQIPSILSREKKKRQFLDGLDFFSASLEELSFFALSFL